MTTVVASANAAPPLRMLIVEDETLVSMFLQDVLQDLGHEVAGTASSVQAALAQCRDGVVADLALIDIGLAGSGDGIDAAIALLDQHGIPSVLMTGAARANVDDRIGRASPLGYLMKPYTENDVQRQLAAVAPEVIRIRALRMTA